MKKVDELFLISLKEVFNSVINSSDNYSAEEIRSICSKKTQKAFSKVNYEIRGSENLPKKQSSIFIYNHLDNHPDYIVSDKFQITLDSHFISSMILDKYYGNPGIRVSRYSLKNEKSHNNYYNKLNLIRVYAKNFIPVNIDKKQVKKVNNSFYKKAEKYLEKGIGMVISPEGVSNLTERSPSKFKSGFLKLALKMNPPPPIVPIVVANFDKLASESIFKCEIKKPIYLKSIKSKIDFEEEIILLKKKINKKYKLWVNDLLNENNDFSQEINNLKFKVEKLKKISDPVIFYGSSTIRLWNSIKRDFPKNNIINLGFGGAYVDSLSKNFKSLFKFKKPRIIIIYLGGNDLNLGIGLDLLTKKIIDFIIKINKKYPDSKIGYISIKPSLERKNKLNEIIMINDSIKKFSSNFDKLVYIDIFNKLLYNGQVTEKYLLQDGLHLNKEGYKILTRSVKKALNL